MHGRVSNERFYRISTEIYLVSDQNSIYFILFSWTQKKHKRDITKRLREEIQFRDKRASQGFYRNPMSTIIEHPGYKIPVNSFTPN